MLGKHCFITITSLLVALLVFGSQAKVAAADERTDGAQSAGSGAAVQEAFCGLGVAPLSLVLAAQLPEVIGHGRGIVVSHVVPGSPADKAGLKMHDIVIQYDKQDVYSPEQLVKLVRHDQPGREVTIAYVRGGKSLETKMMLGETGAQADLRGSKRRSSTGDQADGNAARHGRGAGQAGERTRQNDPQPWARFESLTVTRLPDGRFKAQIDFRDRDEKMLHRDYSGTREEIRKALEADKELPAAEREHLLRSIDQQSPHLFQLEIPRALHDLFEMDSDLFNWPSLTF
jgi:hypothetical protein